MGLYIDIHVHTRRHSTCSHIDPELLVHQALRAGLDGLVITEHQYQWGPEELAALAAQSHDPHFLLLAGFEYSTTHGDLLVYGLTTTQAAE
ncbi:MAG: PHP domain-containing protein, partial [Candidatus Hydrogenedentes bacterium]|nr:PHP domain-containing protein [Candidatus Hydrogenedentota bacterium]